MAVQLGFIAGTLIIATTVCRMRCQAGACLDLCTGCGGYKRNDTCLTGKLSFCPSLPFLTGLTLAGVYPVGMRIAASWYATGLGRALGYLVGALVLGIAHAFGASRARH